MVVVVVHWRLTAAPSPHPKPPPDPPASLQRGIITEIDNVKNSFQKHFLNTRPHLVPRVKHEILSTSRAAVDGWRRFSSLEWIQILCDVAKGCSTEEQSPSPVTRLPVRESAWPGVTTRPQSTPCGPPHGHGSLDGPGRLQHLLLLVRLTSSSLQLNCSRSGRATQAAVIVLY